MTVLVSVLGTEVLVLVFVLEVMYLEMSRQFSFKLCIFIPSFELEMMKKLVTTVYLVSYDCTTYLLDLKHYIVLLT